MAIFRGTGGAGDSNSDATLTAVTAQAQIATTKASEANASAISASASYDSFDDRYLGAKGAAPTVDNDGDALLVGAMYFDTPSDALLIWTGAIWKDTGVSTSTGDLLAANNLSDVASVATARANLELATKRVFITTVSDWPVTLDSTVQYFIDGTVDMGTRSLEIPAGGLHIAGFDLGLSVLISTEDNYTMFTSPVGGSGNVLGADFTMTTSGANSKVYDIVDSNGFHAIEFARVNYDDCTSLGTIDNYRQGLETGTGRFGGTPTLTLKGAWVGGYRITTSIVRSLAAGMTTPLFSAGVGFVMQSRFLTDINIDLPASASFADFAEANFPNPSTLQVQGAIFTRDGVTNASDSNYFPNITAASVSSTWKANQGLPNTFAGGRAVVTTEVATTVSSAGAFYVLAGTFTTTGLQHFDSPSNGQIRHIGNSPREYNVIADLTIGGLANVELTVRLRRYKASTGLTNDAYSQTRQVNNFTGGRDVAFFTIISNVTLDTNDYLFLTVSNATDTNDVTAELSSFFLVQER